METACDGRVLLVGDGDFSFTLSLLKHSELRPDQVTTSNLATEESIQTHRQARDNMADIVDMGGLVHLETDARELHTHPNISKHTYHRIIFNFPLVDRHHIKKNRALLADFFASCSHILSDGGQVMVTLCKGQGGTPADKPLRSWHDSWQVVAQAATSGFILAQIQNFDASRFPQYHSVGFRFQDKSFDTSGSLTHIFEKVGQVDVIRSESSRSLLNHRHENFSCSSYVVEKRKRYLLHEENNPVSLVYKLISGSLSQSMEIEQLDVQQEFLTVKGHKSNLSMKLNEKTSDFDTPQEIDDDKVRLQESTESPTEKSSKDGKDELNRRMQEKAKISKGTSGVAPGLALSHGVLTSKADGQRQLFDGPRSEEKTTFLRSAVILTSDTEAVYSAIRSESGGCTDASERVFHLRTSLLELLPDLLQGPHKVAGHGDGSQAKSECRVLTGQSYQPCDISPHRLPVRHEMLLLRKAEQTSATSSLNSIDESHNDSSMLCRALDVLNKSHLFTSHYLKLSSEDASYNLSIEGVDDITKLNTLDIYQKLTNDDDCTDRRSTTVGLSFLATVQGCSYEVCLINLDLLTCCLCSLPDPRLLWSTNEKFLSQFNLSGFPQLYRPFSLYPMKFVHDLSFWCDTRSKDCVDETKVSDSERCVVDEVKCVVDEVKCVVDEVKCVDKTVDQLEMCDAVRCTVGDIVLRLELMDSSYVEPHSGRRSYWYRLHFMSLDSALPYTTSWKLQSEIRMEVARRLGVELR